MPASSGRLPFPGPFLQRTPQAQATLLGCPPLPCLADATNHASECIRLTYSKRRASSRYETSPRPTMIVFRIGAFLQER